MRVCMGGTFDVLHRGHKALLQTAFEAGNEGVFVGITSDELAQASRERKVRPWAERARDVAEYLRSRGWLKRATIAPIREAFGREASFSPQYDAIAVTPETRPTADKLNAARADEGLPPLLVLEAPYILAEDGLPIKATRIRRGEVTGEGDLLGLVRVRVGSDNPVKVEAARRVLSRIHGELEVRGVPVLTTVPEQPFEEDTWKGAVARAKAALGDGSEAHFGVGIEAGLVWSEAVKDHLDVQWCAIVDRGGRVTLGHGPGFQYPPAVTRAVREEERTVGSVMGDLTGNLDIGKTTGAIGYLTRGALDRTALTESAVLMALVPRFRRELYGL
ncbi:MAG TPA: inosine/xanthosine triphosphatase [Candidatus Thermoplasmatota archaeon]|nr:inosine/xanthosine triphosphatase [Candidatus Thermoplasmatota archaeon]